MSIRWLAVRAFLLIVGLAFAVLARTKTATSPTDALYYPPTEEQLADFGITIVCTVNGEIHGLDKFGRKLWTSLGGEPLVSSENRLQDESSEINSSPQLNGQQRQKRNYAVLPTIDGSLIYSSLEGMRKTRLSANMLTAQSPFFSPEGVSFNGGTRTRTLSLDVRTGDVLFDSEHKLATVKRGEGALPVWFSRVDYVVKAVDAVTGAEEFNLSYSEMHPIPYDAAYGMSAAVAANVRLGGGGQEREEGMGTGAGDDPELSRPGMIAMSGEGEPPSEEEGVDSEPPSSPLRGGGIRRRAAGGGRKKRKNRVKMEQRAGELQALHGQLVELADTPSETLTALDPEALAVVSTPEGELFFCDPEGSLLDRGPVRLQSPAMQAFRLQRTAGQPGTWRVRSVGVQHRILAGGPADSPARTTALTALAAVDGIGGHQAGAEAAPPVEREIRVVVQSPHPRSPSGLYAMEVSEIEYSASPSQRQETASHGSQGLLGPGAGPPLLLTAPPHSPKPGKYTARSLQSRDPEGQKLPPSPIAAAVRRLAVDLKRAARGALAIGQRKGLGKRRLSRGAGAGAGARTGKEDGTSVSPTDRAEEGEADLQRALTPPEHDPWGSLCALQCQCTLPYAVKVHCASPPPPSSQLADLEKAHPKSDQTATSPGSAMRGQHTLRADLYDGALFRQDERTSLFTGMLGPAPTGAAAAEGGHSRGGKRGGTEGKGPEPTHSLAVFDPRHRLSYLAGRLSALSQQLLVLLGALALAGCVLLGLVVLCARNVSPFRLRFPAEESPLAQAGRIVLEAVLRPSAQKDAAGNAAVRFETITAPESAAPSSVHVMAQAEALLDRFSPSAPVPSPFPTPSALPVSPVEGRDSQGRRTLQVGSLVLLPDQVLGYGSHGTVVYRGSQDGGSQDGRPLAVKRVLSQFIKSADREIELLIRSDHPNVVRYFTKVEHSDFVYLGLQLCDMTLKDLVVEAARARGHGQQFPSSSPSTQPPTAEVTEEARAALLQVARGLAHLHAQRIVHRDLKPHNILCCSTATATAERPAAPIASFGVYELKISDMGLSKHLEGDQQSASFTLSSVLPAPVLGRKEASAEAVGTVGWQAPELVRHRYRPPEDPQDHQVSGKIEGAGQGRPSFPADVFSLGCVFYFTLTLGGHPFGQWFEREANIAAGRVDLSGLMQDVLALDLLGWMLQAHPKQRPSSRQVCRHAFFWSPAQRLHFLVEFSDVLEQEPVQAPVVAALERDAQAVVQGGWHDRLDPLLLADLARYRKYDTASVRDLLRVVRNKRHHFNELAPELKTSMGAVPEGFLRYFESRFPQLLLHCVAVAGQHLQAEHAFTDAQHATSPEPLRRGQGTGKGGGVEAVREIACPVSCMAVRTASEGKEACVAPSPQGRGWWESADRWVQSTPSSFSSLSKGGKAGNRAVKVAQDPKYRTRLCAQWEESGGAACSMRKKGKCDFAHGPLELRAKEARRGRWGRQAGAGGGQTGADELAGLASGGENVLGEARLMDKGRRAGKVGSAAAVGKAATVSGRQQGNTPLLHPQMAVEAAYGAYGAYAWQQGAGWVAAGGSDVFSSGVPAQYPHHYQPQPQHYPLHEGYGAQPSQPPYGAGAGRERVPQEGAQGTDPSQRGHASWNHGPRKSQPS